MMQDVVSAASSDVCFFNLFIEQYCLQTVRPQIVSTLWRQSVQDELNQDQKSLVTVEKKLLWTLKDLGLERFTGTTGRGLLALFNAISIARRNREQNTNEPLSHRSSQLIVSEHFLQVVYIVLMRNFPPFVTKKGNFIQFWSKLLISHLLLQFVIDHVSVRSIIVTLRRNLALFLTSRLLLLFLWCGLLPTDSFKEPVDL